MNPHSEQPDSDRPSGVTVVNMDGVTIEHRGAHSFTADPSRYLVIYDEDGVMVALHAPGYWDHAILGKVQA